MTVSSMKILVVKSYFYMIYKIKFVFHFRSVSDRFDIGKSSLHDSFVHVTTVLNRLSLTVINWSKLNK